MGGYYGGLLVLILILVLILGYAIWLAHPSEVARRQEEADRLGTEMPEPGNCGL